MRQSTDDEGDGAAKRMQSTNGGRSLGGAQWGGAPNLNSSGGKEAGYYQQQSAVDGIIGKLGRLEAIIMAQDQKKAVRGKKDV